MKRVGGTSFPQQLMVKIQYPQDTHDAQVGDIRDATQLCAGVLIRLGKAEYITVRHPADQKKKRDAEHGECGTLCGESGRTRNRDVM